MSDSDQLGDLDLEKIAREALASETSERNEGASGISTTTPQPEKDILSGATTQETTKKIKKKLPANWASMDAVARLRGATDELVKEHFEQEAKRAYQAPQTSETTPSSKAFALEKKENVSTVPVRKNAKIVTEKREVTKIAKMAPIHSVEATQKKNEDSIAVGRRFSRSSVAEKTVVFKAEDLVGLGEKNPRAIKLDAHKQGSVRKVGAVHSQINEVDMGDIEEFRDVTEKGVPLNAIPLTGSIDSSAIAGADTLGLDKLDPVLLGSVVVEAPSQAQIFINGKLQGRGRIVVKGIDRYIPFWVRVHLKDHDPWSAQVSLKGENAAKVQPDLY